MSTTQTSLSPSYAYAVFSSNAQPARGGGWKDFCAFAYSLEEAKTCCDDAIENGAHWAHAVCLQTFAIHVDCRAYDINKPFLEGVEEDD